MSGVVGVGASVAAWWNTRKTLAVQRETTATMLAAQEKALAATLAAEAERQRERASFDRAEADRGELRTIFETVAARLTDVTDQLEKASVTLRLYADVKGNAGWALEMLDEDRNKLADANQALSDGLARIDLRLKYSQAEPAITPALKAHDAAGTALAALYRFENENASLTAASTQRYARMVKGLREQFVAEALRFSRSYLHDRP